MQKDLECGRRARGGGREIRFRNQNRTFSNLPPFLPKWDRMSSLGHGSGPRHMPNQAELAAPGTGAMLMRAQQS